MSDEAPRPRHAHRTRACPARQTLSRPLLYANVWDMVGGHREGGVCLDATLRREFEEEIGVTPTAFSELAALTEPAPEINGSDAYDGYAITAWRGPGPAMRGDEHTEIRWFTAAEALALDLALAQFRDVLRCI